MWDVCLGVELGVEPPTFQEKTITLLSPSTQKIELGTSSLMISIFNGVYRFI